MIDLHGDFSGIFLKSWCRVGGSVVQMEGGDVQGQDHFLLYFSMSCSWKLVNGLLTPHKPLGLPWSLTHLMLIGTWTTFYSHLSPVSREPQSLGTYWPCRWPSLPACHLATLLAFHLPSSFLSPSSQPRTLHYCLQSITLPGLWRSAI
jgi:hypothetical protein